MEKIKNQHGFALNVHDVVHRYGDRKALDGLCLQVNRSELFALLGPNGCGKSTLFRLISTLVPLQQGEIEVFGNSVRHDQRLVRGRLGIVFQSPSLDPKLTVRENLWCGSVLYGCDRRQFERRLAEVTEQLGVEDRLHDPVEELSGGLKRRVELAKAIFHRPRLLLMDEPSTGLDPAARLDLWRALRQLQVQQRITIVLTTHLLDEADRADRIAIMDRGQVRAVGSPGKLRQELGHQVLVLRPALAEIRTWLAEREIDATEADGELRITGNDVANLVPALAANFGRQIEQMSVGQPGLEDVFVAKTGHRYWADTTSVPA
ncbi:MAG: ABC transporter ATP-binding protein [Pirellulaceae bacterium]|nr:MAG: ABC transporter ATP-binding protein [Pirellulaceae bacterium]